MSMRFIQLTTHWEADEALTVIEFIDMLRDALWRIHGDRIEQSLREAAAPAEEQQRFEFDDDIPF